MPLPQVLRSPPPLRRTSATPEIDLVYLIEANRRHGYVVHRSHLSAQAIADILARANAFDPTAFGYASITQLAQDICSSGV